MHPSLFLIILAINLTFSTIGDVLARISGITNNNNWLYLSLAFSVITEASFVFLVRIGGLAVPTSVILLLTILINVLFGFLFFHEQIETMQWVGIGTGVLAIVLISNAYKIFL